MEDSLYCEKCQSCGEDSCCEAIVCAYHHMVLDKDDKCLYGEDNYLSVEFYYNLGKALYDEFHEDDRANKIFDEIHEKTYKSS